ncbi:MAG: type IV pilus biogenesis/stability protein PilW [Xenococcus sp. (in: cyanobacteria)]
MGNRNGEAASLSNLGHAYYSLGEYQQSLDIRQDICDLKGETNSLINLANSFVQLDKKTEAETLMISLAESTILS